MQHINTTGLFGRTLCGLVMTLLLLVPAAMARDTEKYGTPQLEAEFMTEGLAIEIQSRLTATGFDTKGIDGKLGGNSRKAMTRWQEWYSMEPTGYFTLFQVDLLRYESHEAYKTFLQKNPDVADITPRIVFMELDQPKPDFPPMTASDKKAFSEND
ncbi:peptidoglycan-binding domain-containing protein [uncultured Cohaesibacter sp.]|uniref:peptidoglycan-binding domain-containing protein n=1 Tax=uncultured Cohaesibacter sp. TaxID=1002546 RepID=UPI00292F707C|nr:peptidoglycan-binding domain-containing protein [uncultured Cohaesibacter sp.]